MRETFQVNNVFWTVQGEGLNRGSRALFVRMPRCNLKCSWCDTDFAGFREMPPAELDFIVDEVHSRAYRLAVVTGGEPMLHRDVPRIVDRLVSKHGFRIAFETNGTAPVPAAVRDHAPFICVSPKSDSVRLGKPAFHMLEEYESANELKLVVDRDFDFATALAFDARMHPDAALWLSPEYDDRERQTQRILDFIAKRPRWRLNVQMHKLIGVP